MVKSPLPAYSLSPKPASASSATYWATSQTLYDATAAESPRPLCSRSSPDHLNCYPEGSDAVANLGYLDSREYRHRPHRRKRLRFLHLARKRRGHLVDSRVGGEGQVPARHKAVAGRGDCEIIQRRQCGCIERARARACPVECQTIVNRCGPPQTSVSRHADAVTIVRHHAGQSSVSRYGESRTRRHQGGVRRVEIGDRVPCHRGGQAHRHHRQNSRLEPAGVTEHPPASYRNQPHRAWRPLCPEHSRSPEYYTL